MAGVRAAGKEHRLFVSLGAHTPRRIACVPALLSCSRAKAERVRRGGGSVVRVWNIFLIAQNQLSYFESGHEVLLWSSHPVTRVLICDRRGSYPREGKTT